MLYGRKAHTAVFFLLDQGEQFFPLWNAFHGRQPHFVFHIPLGHQFDNVKLVLITYIQSLQRLNAHVGFGALPFGFE